MPDSSDIFLHDADMAWQDLGGGVRRKILCYAPSVMLVRVVFESGAVGAAHHHPHIQCTLVARGRFEVTIAGTTRILGAGDSFIVPSGAVHGVVALEDGELVDSFTPMRVDFLN